MGFCINCGNPLGEEDKFCFRCGMEVPKIIKEPEASAMDEVMKAEEVEQPEAISKETEDVEWTKEAPKKSEKMVNEKSVDRTPKDVQRGVHSNKKLPLILGVAAVLVLIVALLKVFGGSTKDKTEYVTYTNNEVRFTLDYPKDYVVKEPNSNNVLIAEGDDADFQVVVEYAYMTVADSAIYSAKDFAQQIEADETILFDWIGTTVNITSHQETTVAGMSCYEYDFDFQVGDADNIGQMYIFDSMGDFGCYTYMAVINENAKDAELYKKQWETMKESLKITGAYVPDGYEMYAFEASGIHVILSDIVQGSVNENSDKDSMVIYPVDSIYSECNIWIEETVYNDEATLDAAMQKACDFYINYRKNASYATQISEIDFGRYSGKTVAIQFYDSGEWYTMILTMLQIGDTYWEVEAKATDAYYDTVLATAREAIASLRIDGTEFKENKETVAETVKETVRETAKETNTVAETEGLHDSNDSDETLTFIAAYDEVFRIANREGYGGTGQAIYGDLNNDGTVELLVSYVQKDSNGASNVMYDLWTVEPYQALRLTSETLYTQAGGNSGYVSIVEKDGTYYVMTVCNQPQGDQFNSYYNYYEWPANASSIGSSGYYYEGHGVYGEEENGNYIWGDQRMDYASVQSYLNQFTGEICRINLNKTAEDNNAMSFSDFLSQ